MRIIAGEARGRRLKDVPGEGTRPITDRAREALFGKLHNWIPDRRVLDLFGGTGSVGLEALSRGARHATFVDRGTRAVATIRANGAACGFLERMEIIRQDSFAYLEAAAARGIGEAWDFVFIAPPQFKDMWSTALALVDRTAGVLTADGLAVVQIDPGEDRELALEHLERFDQRRYGRVMLCYYRLRPASGGT
ncbi:MAG: 16S rRNA (guanine(966)-N(2))-methyltransferase RsmD [Caldilineaceae bacterium SB0666_bin_21]|nr:16S rRNA (guanine(966)-N(2))-methyltransferase RsmD [Caldilineaceae bacterium SB0666_bin_21]